MGGWVEVGLGGWVGGRRTAVDGVVLEELGFLLEGVADGEVAVNVPLASVSG